MYTSQDFLYVYRPLYNIPYLHLLDHGVGEDLGEEHRRLHVLVGDQEIVQVGVCQGGDEHGPGH